MKIFTLTLFLILLTNCSTHTVKLGKKCTKLADDNTYEKSLIWLIDKKNIKSFDQKINKKIVKFMEKTVENSITLNFIGLLVSDNFSPCFSQKFK